VNGNSRTAPWAYLLRISTSVLLLWLLLRRVSVTEVLGLLTQALDRWPLAVATLILPGIGVVVAASRWRALLVAVGAPLPLAKLLRAFLIGNFFNQFFPSTIAGDVVRGWWIRGGLVSTTLSLTIVTTDRVLGLVGICTVGLAVLTTRRDILLTPSMPSWIGLIAMAALMAVVLVGMRRRWGTIAARLVGGEKPGRLAQIRRQIGFGMGRLWRAPSLLAIALTLAILLQLIVMAHFAFLAFVLRIDVGYWDLASLVPLVSLATFLPISVNGIGVREITLASLGSFVGLAPSDAVALSWAFLIVSLVYAAVGGLLYSLGQRGSMKSVENRSSNLRAMP